MTPSFWAYSFSGLANITAISCLVLGPSWWGHRDRLARSTEPWDELREVSRKREAIPRLRPTGAFGPESLMELPSSPFTMEAKGPRPSLTPAL